MTNDSARRRSRRALGAGLEERSAQVSKSARRRSRRALGAGLPTSPKQLTAGLPSWKSLRKLWETFGQEFVRGRETRAQRGSGDPRTAGVGRPAHSARCAASEDARCKMQDARWKMEDARCKMQDGRCKMQDARCKLKPASGIEHPTSS